MTEYPKFINTDGLIRKTGHFYYILLPSIIRKFMRFHAQDPIRIRLDVKKNILTIEKEKKE